MSRHSLLLLLISFFILVSFSCGDDDDDDNFDTPEEDDDDNTDDDDALDDDDSMDDDDDTGDDDDTVYPDDFLAEWPQDIEEDRTYDESVQAGSLREKAEGLDDWHQAHHQPVYGGTVDVSFTDDTRTEVEGYSGLNDSCIWSGIYLGGQAMRYRVTSDQDALNNVLHTVSALHGYLKVNGTTGFISRYWGSQGSLPYEDDAWCDNNERCHRVDQGDYAGDFWIGETSRDQYTGWFFGMEMAYDALADEDVRTQIREDILEVLTTLIDDQWRIIDEEGEPSTKAPFIIPAYRLAWLLTGYHVTGDEEIAEELQSWLLDEKRPLLKLSSISTMNRYAQYYGNNLNHTNWFNVLRLGRVYLSPEDFAFLVEVFENQVHTFTRLSHNAWFNGIFMSQGAYEPGAKNDQHQDQLEQDLTDFPEAPNYRYFRPAPDPSTYTLDPVSVFLHDLQVQFPFLEELMGGVEPQAMDAFPVDQQCNHAFRFEHNPFEIEDCGSDQPERVYPGADYLTAYWLASYYGFLTKDQ